MPIAADQATFLSRCMDTLDSTPATMELPELAGRPAFTTLEDAKQFLSPGIRNIYGLL
jgi:hypothetical protein